MSPVHTILLIPSDGDPHHLLGDPDSVPWRLGWRPPVLYEHRRELRGPACDDGVIVRVRWHRQRQAYCTGRVALPLAAEGVVVEQGCAVVNEAGAHAPEYVRVLATYALHERAPTRTDALRALGAIAGDLDCALLLLDSEGREINLTERT